MDLLGRMRSWAELCCSACCCWDENWRELSGLLHALASGERVGASTDVRPRIGKRVWKVQSAQQPVGRQARVTVSELVHLSRQGRAVKMLSSWMMVGSRGTPAIVFLQQHSVMVGWLHADLQFRDSIGLNSCDPDFPPLPDSSGHPSPMTSQLAAQFMLVKLFTVILCLFSVLFRAMARHPAYLRTPSSLPPSSLSELLWMPVGRRIESLTVRCGS